MPFSPATPRGSNRRLNRLPSQQFVLCHRTVLVNLAYVQYLRYCELELKTGTVLPVSKYRQNAIRDKLMNYLEG